MKETIPLDIGKYNGAIHTYRIPIDQETRPLLRKGIKRLIRETCGTEAQKTAGASARYCIGDDPTWHTVPLHDREWFTTSAWENGTVLQVTIDTEQRARYEGYTKHGHEGRWQRTNLPYGTPAITTSSLFDRLAIQKTTVRKLWLSYNQVSSVHQRYDTRLAYEGEETHRQIEKAMQTLFLDGYPLDTYVQCGYTTSRNPYFAFQWPAKWVNPVPFTDTRYHCLPDALLSVTYLSEHTPHAKVVMDISVKNTYDPVLTLTQETTIFPRRYLQVTDITVVV